MRIEKACVCKNPNKILTGKDGCPNCWTCANCGAHRCSDHKANIEDNQDLKVNNISRKNNIGIEQNDKKFNTTRDTFLTD